MNQLVQFTLRPEALKSLGALTPVAKNLLSPFEADRTLDPAQVTALQKNGILDSAGRPGLGIGAALQVLAAPGSFAQLRLQARPEFFEHIAYFSADGTHNILLTTQGTDVLLSDPAPVQDLVELVRQYIGSSVLRAPTFSADLDYDQALVLAAAIDLYRRAVLRAMADQIELTPPTFDGAAIDAVLACAPQDMRWLVGVMDSIRPIVRPGVASGPLLDRLVAAGHLVPDGKLFRLGEPAALLAGRLLVVDLLLTVSTGEFNPDGGVTLTQLMCLQAGLHDLLTIERCEGNVRFECLSSAAVVEYVNQVFSHAKAPGTVAAPQGAACPRCHAPIAAETKYCAQCGLQLESTCRQCGAPLKGTARFCPKCGTAVAS